MVTIGTKYSGEALIKVPTFHIPNYMGNYRMEKATFTGGSTAPGTGGKSYHPVVPVEFN